MACAKKSKWRCLERFNFDRLVRDWTTGTARTIVLHGFIVAVAARPVTRSPTKDSEGGMQKGKREAMFHWVVHIHASRLVVSDWPVPVVNAKVDAQESSLLLGI